MIQLKNADVVLRRLRKEDAEAMAVLANNRKVSINLRDGFHYPYTLEHAQAFINRFIEQKPLSVFAIKYKGIYMNKNSQIQALDQLKRLKEIFDRDKIRYWLDAGTLLCAYRDGNLEYEHYIDIGIFIEDFPKIRKIVD